jgi:hypothetical protein
MIQYQNTHTIIALQMAGQYLFKVPHKDPPESKELDHVWRSVDASTIDKMIESIDQSVVDPIKPKIQSADKFAIRLLLISAKLFHSTLTIFEPLSIGVESSGSDTETQMNTFVPLHITDLRQVQSIDRMPWKLIYINNLLKSRGLPLAITQWNVVISPLKYIFESCNACDMSMRLIQLHKAIAQIQDDDQLSNSSIYQLSQTLDESISKFDFSLPDICLHYQYPTYQPVDQSNIVQQGVLLIANLASLGVVNNCAELSNIGSTGNGIAFKSYQRAILAEMHGVPFDFHGAETMFNLVYKQTQPISKDSVWVFNCLTMYDTIRLMLSIQRQGTSDQKAKTQAIIVDANSIMKQVYDTKPAFDKGPKTLGGPSISDHKKSVTAAIGWLYEKHFGEQPKCLPLMVSKDYDSSKYGYLSKYLYQFEFNQSK